MILRKASAKGVERWCDPLATVTAIMARPITTTEAAIPAAKMEQTVDRISKATLGEPGNRREPEVVQRRLVLTVALMSEMLIYHRVVTREAVDVMFRDLCSLEDDG